MPEFVQSIASQQLPTPLYLPGVKIHSFMIEMSMDVVQRYCDKYFNLGNPRDRDFVYKPVPLFPYATLMVLEYPVMVAADRTPLPTNSVPFYERGYMSQNEVFLGVPVMRHGTSMGNFLRNVAVQFAYPFMVVDNATSTASGREILGFPKLPAEITLTEGVWPGSLAANVKMFGWPSLDPECLQELMPFLSVTTGPKLPYVGPSAEVSSVWSLGANGYLRKGMEAFAAGYDMLDQLTCGLIPSPLHVVALKQFRQAERPHEAVYQAIIDAKPRYYNVRDLQFYNEQDVDITFFDRGSFDGLIREFLDPPPNESPIKSKIQHIEVAAKMACSFTADIDYTGMFTIHSFTEPRHRNRGGGSLPVNDMISPWLRPWQGFWDLS